MLTRFPHHRRPIQQMTPSGAVCQQEHNRPAHHRRRPAVFYQRRSPSKVLVWQLLQFRRQRVQNLLSRLRSSRWPIITSLRAVKRPRRSRNQDDKEDHRELFDVRRRRRKQANESHTSFSKSSNERLRVSSVSSSTALPEISSQPTDGRSHLTAATAVRRFVGEESQTSQIPLDRAVQQENTTVGAVHHWSTCRNPASSHHALGHTGRSRESRSQPGLFSENIIRPCFPPEQPLSSPPSSSHTRPSLRTTAQLGCETTTKQSNALFTSRSSRSSSQTVSRSQTLPSRQFLSNSQLRPCHSVTADPQAATQKKSGPSRKKRVKTSTHYLVTLVVMILHLRVNLICMYVSKNQSCFLLKRGM